MTNLEYRSPLHWLTAWARRVGSRLAGLVDLIAAHCHEVLGVSSSTIAEAINRQIVVPLVRYHYGGSLRDAFCVRRRWGRILLGVRARKYKPLPKWWESFAGYEVWCHDGTCGNLRTHARQDWAWLLEHWPSLATGYRPPLLRAGQSIRETTKILSVFGLNTKNYVAVVEELKKKLIELTSGPAVVLPDGCELEYVEVPPRRFGYSLTNVLSKPGTYVMQARSHGKREAMRQYEEMLKAEGHDVLMVDPKPGSYARIEAQRRALARDFPGFARRYFDTGHMKRSVRMGENAGINALTGALTVWIPEPQEAEAIQEPPEGVNPSQSGDLELSGPVWGPSPTREFFRQMRARRKERPVRTGWRVVIAVPPAESDEAAELWCQQIANEILENVAVPGDDPRARVKILCNEEAGDITSIELVAPDEASTLKPGPGEPDVPASGDEIKEDGTAPDLKDEDEAPE